MALAKSAFSIVDEGGFFAKARSAFPELPEDQLSPARMGVYPHQVTYSSSGKVDVFMVCFFKSGEDSEFGPQVVKWCKEEVENALAALDSGSAKI
jgi:hypothetical protein